MNVIGGNGFGQSTQNAGTVISVLIPPRVGAVARLDKFAYTTGATAHTITVLRPLGPAYNPAVPSLGGTTQYPGSVQCAAAGASGQAVIVLNYLPGSKAHQLQANDLVAIQETDGVTRLYIVSSVSTLTITLTGNLTAGVAVNSWVHDFGVLATVNPIDGTAHPNYNIPASETGVGITIPTDAPAVAGLVSTYFTNQPLLVQSNNVTNAGNFDYLEYYYTAPSVSGPGNNW
jgi:hypothetical protein